MSYTAIRAKTAQMMGDTPVCRPCGASASLQTLSDHGGMCFACHSAYCRAAPPRPRTDVKLSEREAAGPRAWAHRLRAAEKAGYPLAAHQKAAWREVLSERVGAEA